MPYFLIRILDDPHSVPTTAMHVVDLLAEVETEATAVEVDRDAAIAAGGCPWCPIDCRSCPGNRADCECYSHQPDGDVPC